MRKVEVPPDLFSLQKWFGSIISRPISSNSEMMPLSPSGRPLSQESEEHIRPNRKLTSQQRIEIYNQQYWWRLLSILHENFPTMTRLFGYADFNLSIGMPFLTKYPSRDWSLARLGDQLPLWVKQCYQAQDKELILAAAEVDWSYQELFFAQPPLDIVASPQLISKKLMLQPHLKIFKFPFDIFSLRAALLKEEVDLWLEKDFPPLKRDRHYFFALYRTNNYQIQYREIEEGQWEILHLLSLGKTIEEACDQLEMEGGDKAQHAQRGLGGWIQNWLNEKWITQWGEVRDKKN